MPLPDQTLLEGFSASGTIRVDYHEETYDPA